MRTNFDFGPFRRSSVGFDQLFDQLERGSPGSGEEAYPPFDIQTDGADQYRIILAVAGFDRGDLDIVAQQNQLVVSGKPPQVEQAQFVHKGIAYRPFERRFALGDYVKVQGADLANGLLTISLIREIPDAIKPHNITINSA